jgi:DNA-binding MarR family transcriptional regulator
LREVAPHVIMAAMDRRLPLPTLLSHALVAFTIEFDNEFERQMPHRKTRHGAKGGSLHAPWLVSLVMFSNCMQFIGEEGVPVGQLECLARTATNLPGMERWGYIVVEPDPAESRPKPPRSEWVIRATPAGRKAQDVWRHLFDAIEKRWRERFGTEEIQQLRESLLALATQLDVELPDCLPILGYGLFSKGPDQELQKEGRRGDGVGDHQPLSVLLSRVLLAFAIEFERESELSLAISANVVRILDGKGVRVQDLPALSGVSKESISTALSFLSKRGFAKVDPDPGGTRAQVARLTPSGREAQKLYGQIVQVVEDR